MKQDKSICCQKDVLCGTLLSMGIFRKIVFSLKRAFGGRSVVSEVGFVDFTALLKSDAEKRELRIRN